MKVVINRCYGGFGLSTKAFERLIELGMTVTVFNDKGNALDKDADIIKHEGEFYGDYSFVKSDSDTKIRTDKRLIQVVEELGNKSSGDCAELKVVDVPLDNTDKFRIEEYDGMEWIAEKHRTWN